MKIILFSAIFVIGVSLIIFGFTELTDNEVEESNQTPLSKVPIEWVNPKVKNPTPSITIPQIQIPDPNDRLIRELKSRLNKLETQYQEETSSMRDFYTTVYERNLYLADQAAKRMSFNQDYDKYRILGDYRTYEIVKSRYDHEKYQYFYYKELAQEYLTKALREP